MRPALTTSTTSCHKTSHSGVRRCVAGGAKFDCLRRVALDSHPRDPSNDCLLFPETRSPALLKKAEECFFFFGVRDIRIHLLECLSHFLTTGKVLRKKQNELGCSVKANPQRRQRTYDPPPYPQLHLSQTFYGHAHFKLFAGRSLVCRKIYRFPAFVCLKVCPVLIQNEETAVPETRRPSCLRKLLFSTGRVHETEVYRLPPQRRYLQKANTHSKTRHAGEELPNACHNTTPSPAAGKHAGVPGNRPASGNRLVDVCVKERINPAYSSKQKIVLDGSQTGLKPLNML